MRLSVSFVFSISSENEKLCNRMSIIRINGEEQLIEFICINGQREGAMDFYMDFKILHAPRSVVF